MVLSNRTKKIIQLILNQKGYITVGEIASKMNISQRTAYRELPEAESVMKQYGIQLITASKKGVTVSGNAESLKELRSFLGKLDEVLIVNPEERSDFVLLYLLKQEDYVKMEALAIDHQCGLSTIKNDLQKARQRVSGYEIKIIQQKGQGVKISGALMEKNHLITDILLRWADETVIYHWLDQNDEESNPFLSGVEEYGFREIMQQMHVCLKKVVYQKSQFLNGMKTREYLEIVLLLSFMIYYHKSGQIYQQYMETDLEGEEAQELYHRIRKRIQEDFSVEFKENELTYLQWVMQFSIGKEADQMTTIRHQVLNHNIMKFIEYVEEKIGIVLAEDKELRAGLYTHMDKALLRIRSNMQIENPALLEIKENYGEIFDLVRNGVKIFFPQDYFPDDEIGYLVLYFALALDKLTKRLFKVLVVCSGGMGSSKMLASALEREIPEVNVVKTLSVVALEKEDLRNYDLILSTIPLYLDDDAYLRISPMLHKNEVLLIREKILRHKHNMLRHIDETERGKGKYQNTDNEAVIAQVNEVCQMVLDMISNFQFYTGGGERSLKDIVESILHSDLSVGINDSRLEIIKDSQFVIPTTSITYYEGECKGLKCPRICSVYEDKKSINASGGNWNIAIIVLYPEDLRKHNKKALNFLVEEIVQDERFLRYICQKDIEEIKNCIGFYMRQYLSRALKE